MATKINSKITKTQKGSIFIEFALAAPVIIIFAFGILCLNRNIAAKQLALETAYEATLMFFRDCPRVPSTGVGGSGASFGKLILDTNGSITGDNQFYLTNLATCIEKSLNNLSEICRLNNNPAKCQVGLQVLFPAMPNASNLALPGGPTTYCGIQTTSNNTVITSGTNPTFPNPTFAQDGMLCGPNPIGNITPTNQNFTTSIVCCAQAITTADNRFKSRDIAISNTGNITVNSGDAAPSQLVIGYSRATFTPPMKLFGQITLDSTNIMHD